ncbi:hypothetical protein WICMUC_005137 [Wickerhamomyces mucosus]|uniref:RING-type domain-containing protein n=1 Tax=Wickerhamomyces mucosus TaxID=1378264 RepID=A0A9P8T6Y6_9ASCO|nr:hypothetical protein WICMUC_005137 [Wickerhamomyces mucosus]
MFRSTTNSSENSSDDESRTRRLPTPTPTPDTLPLNELNLRQINSNDPDVLFSGSLGNVLPEFSITINRTNIPTNSQTNRTGGGSETPAPIFDLNNVPRALRDIVETFMQNIPSNHPVKRATTNAIEQLKVVDINKLNEEEQKCPICYEEFDQASIEGEKSEIFNIDDRFKEFDDDPLPWFPIDSTGDRDNTVYKSNKETVQRENNPNHSSHIPVQMPCGHIFGKSCLVEWLKSNVSCPLCRREVEDSNVSSKSLIINRSFCPAHWSSLEDHTSLDPSIPVPISILTQRPGSSRANRGTNGFFDNVLNQTLNRYRAGNGNTTINRTTSNVNGQQ